MSEENPYQAPSLFTPTQISSQPLEVIPVGKGLRFANYLIDVIIAQLATGFMLGFVARLILGEEQFIAFLEADYLYLIVYLILPTYYIVLEGIFGRTLGKLITGTKVVDGFGYKPSLGNIIGRNFARLIPFDAFTYLGATSRGWHDSLSGTYVVKCR